MTTDDIVARLREQYRGELSAEAADEIERLRAERDAARAEICLLRTGPTSATENATKSLIDYAGSRGWADLFKEETDGR